MNAENFLPNRDPQHASWQQLLSELGLLEKARATFPAWSSLLADGKPAKALTIQHALSLLTEPCQLVEMRILGINGKRRTDSGYFSDLEKLARAALSYDGRAEGIYFTLNPVKPDLVARADHRVKEYAEHTSSDADILKRITLPIDFDSVRPAGISSNEIEKRAALERAWACQTWLTAQGWPEPVFADSGNGAHLLYAIDLPNIEASTALVKGCLVALGTLFSDDQVKVDTSTSNASRIFKLYGTLARKGDSTLERPHRRAAIITAPVTRKIVAQSLLEQLAARIPVAPKAPISSRPTLSIVQSPNRRYGQAALNQELSRLAEAQPGNRNNQLFKSAAALFSLVAAGTLDENEVWQALLSTAQAIGLSDQEARRTIQSGIERGSSQPRVLPQSSSNSTLDTPLDKLNIRQADPPAAPQSSESKPFARKSTPAADILMHVDDLDELPPIHWLIQDYLPEDSLVEVYGAPSTGKTQVVFDMAQTLAASGKTVIYVVAEGLRGYRSRKKAWQKFRKQAGGDLYIWPEPVQLFEHQSVHEFISAIQPKKPVLVVFDTLSRCSLGADENNQKDMGFILDSLDSVRRETGATVIAVHHTNANGARERGSTVVRGGMDVMMEVSKEDDLIAVSCSKVKDSAEFNTLYLKPVLVEIDEERPVPVLIPAAKQVQTQADKLSTMQLDILRAVGMEMFKVSGIRSSQLDELLPPTVKRASKYYSLNNLIRLGYVAPHDKGDPYLITDAGRLKLSNAENAMTTAMSNMSKASLSPFIWTLPESCPMSSLIPHTSGCGIDKTLDNKATVQTTATTDQPQTEIDVQNALNTPVLAMSNVQQSESKQDSTADITTIQANPEPVAVELDEEESSTPDYPIMSQLDISRYAEEAEVKYPTIDGAELYQIAQLVPLRLRTSFEAGLGDLYSAYLPVMARRGEPPELPIPDILELYLNLGFMLAADLHKGYERACLMGHKQEFWNALTLRNEKALECLKAMIAGRKLSGMVLVPRLPKYPNGAPTTT